MTDLHFVLMGISVLFLVIAAICLSISVFFLLKLNRRLSQLADHDYTHDPRIKQTK